MFGPVTVIGNQDHRFLIDEQLAEVGVSPRQIILEPVARNTAAAAAVAALVVAAEDEGGLILFVPADHVIPDAEVFGACVRQGISAAEQGALITFGAEADHPHTGYGYLEIGERIGDVWNVERFVEKPTREVAEEYLGTGRFLWNAGIFLFTARQIIGEFESHAPDILDAARSALSRADDSGGVVLLDEEAYSDARNISFDYAIVEKSINVCAVPLQTVWSDVGSWSAVWNMLDRDQSGNAAHGDSDVTMYDTVNSYAYSDQAHVALVGLDNVIVVATKDAILVTSKDSTESIKELVTSLKGREDTLQHARVYRPWGWYEVLTSDGQYQVKRLFVKPGGALSLQSHQHRAEHWVVVEGTASVTIGHDTRLLSENEATYIPIGERHRLANPGDVPALLIEVQLGSYLGEDDIVRYEDIYGRFGNN